MATIVEPLAGIAQEDKQDDQIVELQSIVTALSNLLTELQGKLEAGQEIALDAASLAALENITVTVDNLTVGLTDGELRASPVSTTVIGTDQTTHVSPGNPFDTRLQFGAEVELGGRTIEAINGGYGEDITTQKQQSVTTSAAEILAANIYRGNVTIMHLSGDPVRIGTNTVTASTGFVRMSVGDVFIDEQPGTIIDALYAIVESGTSATLLVGETTIQPTVAWSPKEIEGVLGWFDAGLSSTVDGAGDLVLTNLLATGTGGAVGDFTTNAGTPTIQTDVRGKKYVNFTGTDSMSAPHATVIQAAVSVIVIGAIDQDSNGSFGDHIIRKQAGGESSAGWRLRTNTANGQVTGFLYDGVGGSSFAVASSLSVNDTVFVTYMRVSPFGDPEVEVRFNDDTAQSGSPSVSFPIGTADVYLGASDSDISNGTGFLGKIYGVILASNELSDEDFTRIAAYYGQFQRAS